MIYTDFEQRSPEWLQMRKGCGTASRAADMMAKLKRGNGEAAARANYRKELVIERLTGRTADHYVSQYMEQGTWNEPLARAAYELATDADVNPIGFALHDEIKWFGASPDALVGDDGLLEIKCLKSENHLDIIDAGEIPDEYKPQMLAEMACTGRLWVDFVAFDPWMPEHLKLFVARFKRNDEAIAAMESEVKTFLAEVAAKVTRFNTADLTAILEASVAEAK